MQDDKYQPPSEISPSEEVETTPSARARAIRAFYGPHCIVANIEPGAVTEAIEAQIIAAVTVDRERCAALVRARLRLSTVDGGEALAQAIERGDYA